MTNKNVKEHIKSFVLESMNENNTPDHFELEKSCLTDTKTSDVLGLFVIKENEYRLLITSLFENDSFINDITASQEFYNPISTQDFFLQKNKSFLLLLHLPKSFLLLHHLPKSFLLLLHLPKKAN